MTSPNKYQQYAHRLGPYKFTVTISPSPWPVRRVTNSALPTDEHAGIVGRLGDWIVIDSPTAWKDWKSGRI